jgi:hypothetical protein
MKIIFILLGLIVLWSIWGYVSSNVEQAEYTVLEKAKGYEIRQYAPHIEAQTTINGSYDDTLNKGFMIIAGYIFGGNTKKQVADVGVEEDVSEKIAMTAPVVAQARGESRVIAFVMPKSYSLETLPIPNDDRVRLVEVPEKKVAVLRFFWFRNADRVEEMEKRLLSYLERDSLEPVGAPSYAGYNAPWTPPWMLRNEIMVEIK